MSKQRGEQLKEERALGTDANSSLGALGGIFVDSSLIRVDFEPASPPIC